MSDPQWCSHCGAQHTGAGSLCEKCVAAGVAAAAPVAAKPPPPVPVAEEKKPLNVPLVMGGSVAVVLVAAVIFLLVGGSKTPAAASDKESPPTPTAVPDPFASAGPGEPAPFREEPGAPALPPAGIAGEYWRDTEPPGRPRKMSLCPDGSYFEYAARAGRWTSTGTDEGKVSIAMESGRAVELDYRILREPRFCSKAGCDAEFSGARYGRDPTLGNCR